MNRSPNAGAKNISSAEIERLKVDVLAIAAGAQSNRVLTFININVPVTFIKDEEGRQNILKRIYKYIEIEFSAYDNLNIAKRKYLTSEIDVEITATYTLRNLVTDEIKHWTGSFNPSANDMGSLMGFVPMSQFKTSEAFVSHVSQRVDPNIALRQLTWKGGNTKFKVEEIKSIILNFQCSLPLHHRFLQRRNVGGSARRVRTTYDLP